MLDTADWHNTDSLFYPCANCKSYGTIAGSGVLGTAGWALDFNFIFLNRICSGAVEILYCVL